MVNRERVSGLEFLIMLALFLCIVMISMAKSAEADSEPETADLKTAESSPASPDGKLWLGLILCVCHAWLFSGIGVISRRLQDVHFSELMIH